MYEKSFIEITKTEEKTVYIADDGTRFFDKESCMNYESSEKFLIDKDFSKLVVGSGDYYSVLASNTITDEYIFIVHLESEKDVYTVLKKFEDLFNSEKLINYIGKDVLIARGEYDSHVLGTIDELIDKARETYNKLSDKGDENNGN